MHSRLRKVKKLVEHLETLPVPYLKDQYRIPLSSLSRDDVYRYIRILSIMRRNINWVYGYLYGFGLSVWNEWYMDLVVFRHHQCHSRCLIPVYLSVNYVEITDQSFIDDMISNPDTVRAYLYLNGNAKVFGRSTIRSK